MWPIQLAFLLFIVCRIHIDPNYWIFTVMKHDRIYRDWGGGGLLFKISRMSWKVTITLTSLFNFHYICSWWGSMISHELVTLHCNQEDQNVRTPYQHPSYTCVEKVHREIVTCMLHVCEHIYKDCNKQNIQKHWQNLWLYGTSNKNLLSKWLHRRPMHRKNNLY
jgi:hypothetical protein